MAAKYVATSFMPKLRVIVGSADTATARQRDPASPRAQRSARQHALLRELTEDGMKRAEALAARLPSRNPIRVAGTEPDMFAMAAEYNRISRIVCQSIAIDHRLYELERQGKHRPRRKKPRLVSSEAGPTLSPRDRMEQAILAKTENMDDGQHYWHFSDALIEILDDLDL
jgi:hypothetical protein